MTDCGNDELHEPVTYLALGLAGLRLAAGLVAVLLADLLAGFPDFAGVFAADARGFLATGVLSVIF